MATAFVFLHNGSAPARPVNNVAAAAVHASSVGESTVAEDRMATAVHRDAARQANRAARRAREAARRRHLAALAAARRAQQAAAAKAAAAKAAAAKAAATPTPTPTDTAPPPSSGGDAADSALGVCVRDAEEGGSYAWGPGNGGGAYQFEIGTWEHYGGAAGEFGVAGAAYQDQIFDNAVAAGGASNWTAYDGC